MKLTWHGNAALLVEAGEETVAFDPFTGIPAGAAHPEPDAASAAAFRAAKAVFATHGHFDHIMQIPALYARGTVPIYATDTPCRTLARRGVPAERLHRLAPGDEIRLGALTIRAYQGRHCRFDAALIARMACAPRVWKNALHALRLLYWNRIYPENGETVFYELRADGKRLEIMGSMGLDGATEYPAGADALVLPFQGRSDPARLGETLVARLQPKAVLLDHFDDSFPPLTATVDTAAFEALIARRYGIPCRTLGRGETIAI